MQRALARRTVARVNVVRHARAARLRLVMCVRLETSVLVLKMVESVSVAHLVLVAPRTQLMVCC